MLTLEEPEELESRDADKSSSSLRRKAEESSYWMSLY
jgi:hypothetical protein